MSNPTRIVALLSLLMTALTATAQQANRTGQTGAAQGGGTGLRIDPSAIAPDVDAAFGDNVQRAEGVIGRSASDIIGFGAAAQAANQTGLGGGFGRGGGLGGGFGLGGFGLGGFGLGNSFGNRAGGNQAQEPLIRTRLVSQIEVATPSTAQRLTDIQTTLERLPIADRFEGVNIELQGRTVILSGNVASIKDRKLVERLIKLEPGVSTVTNNVEVVTLEEIPAGRNDGS